MKPPPLTPEMQGALDHLRASGDRAFVRIYSQWWVRESARDKAVQWLPPSMGGEGAAANDEDFVTVFRTGTIRGLVTRGLLRYTGPIVKGIQFHDRARAELTSS